MTATIDITFPDAADHDLINQAAYEAIRAVNAQASRDSDGNVLAAGATLTVTLGVGAPGIDVDIDGATLDTDIEDELEERVGGHLHGALFPIAIS